ncbi:Metallothionein expression activator [Emydomyces testavorans]|uniref:Metallothionein expression activator n=1 Tax=Emydomyces testavorans TaxID=2070801 RepID=A0AAF0DCT6_9EURO|nr:Metallothionein expression activator [Emydomyces testavorans]
MLAAFNANFDRTENIFQQHGLSTGSDHINVAAKPIPPPLRHRRGLSLDQGMAKSRQKTNNVGFEHFEPFRWQDVTSGLLLDEALLQRPGTPIKTDLARISRACKTAQSSPAKQHVTMPRDVVAMERAKSLQGVACSFAPRETLAPSSNTDSLQSLDTFDLQLSNMNDDVFSDFTFHSPGNFDMQTLSSPISPTMPPFLSLSGIVNEQDPTATTKKAAKIPIAPVTPLMPGSQRTTAASSRSSSPAKTLLSPRALSIADLNLDSSIDASIEETGVTLDDIAAHIGGPDPSDNKWVCTYEGCNKRFGRKENIKSHVQTHLGDRQFKCNHCNKCFVRGHDLKRHSKIHTGVKPYPCECGNSFARHDALTRHKQRGMCSGAFAGAVRKPLRRGRPKKRPAVEERREKAAKTREHARKGHARTLSESSCASFASSASECADSSSVGRVSPAMDLPFLETSEFGLPPDAFSFTPPASPSYSTGNIPSPARSYRSLALDPDLKPLYLSPSKRPLDDIPEEIPDIPLLAPGSPVRIKPEMRAESPTRILWPTTTEPDGIGETDNTNLDDVFISNATETTLNQDQLPALDPSTTDISEPNSSQYDAEYFLNPAESDGSDLLSTHLFPVSFSPETEAFFDRFTMKNEV